MILKKIYLRHTGEYQYPFMIRWCFNHRLRSSPQWQTDRALFPALCW